MNQDALSERIRSYLRIFGGANLGFTLTMGGVAFIFPEPWFITLVVLLAVNCAFQIAAYRIAGRGDVERSAVLQAIGMWSISIAMAFGGISLYALSVGIALLGVIAAVPYVSQKVLFRLALAMPAIAGLGSFFVIGEPLYAIEMPVSTVIPFIAAGAVAIVAASALSVWHTRVTLGDATSGIESANRALRASEEELERKVARRSQALERSQAALGHARDGAIAANRHKSAFLANMSHELRTPLNAIIGFSEVLGQRVFGELGDKQAEYMTDIHGSGHHLLALINDILDFSKIEAGRMELSLSPVHLQALLENALMALDERAREAGVTLERNLSDGIGDIAADERRLRQVIDNLLSNAVKYTGEGGIVTLTARPIGDEVEVAIADTGVGISPGDQAIIFEAFRQTSRADADYAHSHEGTGVGLALTRKLVELHGGRVSVESEVGRGSTFQVVVPRSAGATTAVAT